MSHVTTILHEGLVKTFTADRRTSCDECQHNFEGICLLFGATCSTPRPKVCNNARDDYRDHEARTVNTFRQIDLHQWRVTLHHGAGDVTTAEVWATNPLDAALKAVQTAEIDKYDVSSVEAHEMIRGL